jgi:hypothetical protein
MACDVPIWAPDAGEKKPKGSLPSILDPMLFILVCK